MDSLKGAIGTIVEHVTVVNTKSLQEMSEKKTEFDQFVISVLEEHLTYEENRGKAAEARLKECLEKYAELEKSQQNLKTLGTVGN